MTSAVNTDDNFPRPLHVIAEEIRTNWRTPYFGAVPYIDALSHLSGITDSFYAEDARSIVMYFLSNAFSWRGPTARRIKAELNSMLRTSQRRAH